MVTAPNAQPLMFKHHIPEAMMGTKHGEYPRNTQSTAPKAILRHPDAHNQTCRPAPETHGGLHGGLHGATTKLHSFVFPPQSVALPESESGARTFDFEKFRTVTCNSYRRGKNCSFEKKCFFAHGPNELRRNPYTTPYSSELCPDAKETKACQHGNDCKFSRNFTEYLYHPKRYKTRMCENFFKGKCERGDTCAFIHDHNPSIEKGTDVIKIDFHGARPLADAAFATFVRTHVVNGVIALLNGHGGVLTWESIELTDKEMAMVQNQITTLLSKMEPAPKPDSRLLEASWNVAGHNLVTLTVTVGLADSGEVYFNDEDQAFVLEARPANHPHGIEDVYPVQGKALAELCRKRFLGSRPVAQPSSAAQSNTSSPHRGRSAASSAEVSPRNVAPHHTEQIALAAASALAPQPQLRNGGRTPSDPMPLPYQRFTPAAGAVFVAGSGAFSPHCGSFSPLVDESRQCAPSQTAKWQWPPRH